MPLDEKTCLMLDRTWNYHIKSYSPEDEEYASQQFPLPSYANNRNPNVIYSVEYLDLYRYLFPQEHIYHFDKEKLEYAQFVHVGDCRIAIQFDRLNPVVILDLNRPNDPPLILQDVYGINCLDAYRDFLVWYEERTGLVFLYHEKLKKRKILNFSKVKVEQLHILEDHVVIAVSKRNLEVLDYSRNKRIKSVGILNDRTPNVVVHYEGNVITYIDAGHIHAIKTEKGKIKWEREYDWQNYEEDSIYAFIAHNLIALEHEDKIHVLLLDSQNFSLHVVIQHPWLGFLETPDQKILCCERAQKKGAVLGIDPLRGNRFAVVEFVCRGQTNWHGHQRVSVFSLENLTIESPANHPLPGARKIWFTLRKSILFEEYRDPVRIIDILDETVAMFITERGKIFQVNLKDYSIEYAIELSSLLKKNSQNGLRKIDKFFALNQNKVVISTKEEPSSKIRIVVFSLETRTFDFNSLDLEEDGENPVFFYDMVKLSPDRLFLTYKRYIDEQWKYFVGELTDENDVCDFDPETRVAYDRLWNIGGESSLVAMRHASNVFDLSFMDPNEDAFRVKQKFSAEKYVIIVQNHLQGILDVKLVTKDVVCIQLKMRFDESVVLVYNFQREKLLNQIRTSFNIVGTIKRCGKLGNMEKTIIFGFYGSYDNGLGFKSVQDITTKKESSLLINDDNQDLRILPSNFQPFLRGNQALVYENDCHKNFICILKSPNFKLECLRVLQKAVSNKYHNYIYKDIVDTIFGVKV